MSVGFLRGQQLGRDDLNIFLTNASGHPINAAEISYAIYDFTTRQEVLVGSPQDPVEPNDRGILREHHHPARCQPGGLPDSVVHEVVGGPSNSRPGVQRPGSRNSDAHVLHSCPVGLDSAPSILLRDQNPDKFYKFRPRRTKRPSTSSAGSSGTSGRTRSLRSTWTSPLGW